MASLRAIAIVILTPVALASCSGGGGGGSPQPPGQTPPPDITRSFVFPSGDAVATKGTAWDIIGLKTTLSGTGNNVFGDSYDMLRVDVTFAQDVSAAVPAPGSSLDFGNQIGVAIAIDADGNPGTGYTLTCDTSSKLTPFEFLTDQGNGPGRLADGNYSIYSNARPIYRGPSNPHAEAVFAVSKNTLSYSFTLNTLGVSRGSQVPRIGVAAFVFNATDFFYTDCVPTVKSGTVEVFTAD